MSRRTPAVSDSQTSAVGHDMRVSRWGWVSSGISHRASFVASAVDTLVRSGDVPQAPSALPTAAMTADWIVRRREIRMVNSLTEIFVRIELSPLTWVSRTTDC
ncbi:hypothetical protein GCM10009560_41500 [Nonomuraea longicatena]|uniref:Uncharacterized protein n=1 Tax=Nonomuraea longicatena TaxID=83682 RepID=A0ABN1PYF7_9ACTN